MNKLSSQYQMETNVVNVPLTFRGARPRVCKNALIAVINHIICFSMNYTRELVCCILLFDKANPISTFYLS